ncbi:MAG: RHS repeat-associated core domain-containing protein [Lentisphaeria bacterium]|nr:RHS repeat-associated core domain-containing protein [Lentisphaeria bacterium]
MLADVFFVAYGRRSYSPVLGRWINRDPIGEKGGFDLYVFLRNSPLGVFDFLGLQEFEKNIMFVYRKKSGRLAKLTEETTSNDLQISYDAGIEDGGKSGFRYLSSTFVDYEPPTKDSCTVRLLLYVEVSHNYKGKGNAYVKPTAATLVSYIPHLAEGADPSEASGAFIDVFGTDEDKKQLYALMSRKHELGHAEGHIKTVFKNDLAGKISAHIKWDEVATAIAAGRESDVAKKVNAAINNVYAYDNEIFAVHAPAADKATKKIFDSRPEWSLQNTQNTRPRLKWNFAPSN